LCRLGIVQRPPEDLEKLVFVDGTGQPSSTGYVAVSRGRAAVDCLGNHCGAEENNRTGLYGILLNRIPDRIIRRRSLKGGHSMPALVDIKPHLTVEELEERFKRCRHPIEKTHLQAIYLRAKGMRTSEVAKICGYKDDWVQRLVRRYNAHGPDALSDGHRRNRGQMLLSAEQIERLKRAVVDGAPSEGGLWTGPKVAQWIADELQREIHPQRGWDYLRRLGMTKKTPRPRHPEASAAEQAEFKKTAPALDDDRSPSPGGCG
jgi:transposase